MGKFFLKFGISLLMAALSLTIPALADPVMPGAKVFYDMGVHAEQTGDFKAAIVYLQQSLKDDPGFYLSDLQLGNCYYYTGDRAQALQYYYAYLSVNPFDAKTDRFADSLRSQLGIRDHIYGCDLLAGWDTYALKNGPDGPGINWGAGAGFIMWYRFFPMLEAGLKFDYLWADSYYSGYSYVVPADQIFSVPAFEIAPTAALIIPLIPNHLELRGSVEAGFLSLHNAYSSYPLDEEHAYESSSSADSLSGEGLCAGMGVGISLFLAHHVAIEYMFGYRYGFISPVWASGGFNGILNDAQGNNLVLNYTGVESDAGVGLWF